MKYNKLVRDKIPQIIEKSGKTPITHNAGGKEYWKKLKEKLSEEVCEFIEKGDEEELADILEVIDAICEFRPFDKQKIKSLRRKKLVGRGGFRKKIILDEVI